MLTFLWAYALHQVLDMGILDVLMFSINPAYDYQQGEYGIGSAGDRMGLYRRCEKEGVGISAMKAFGGGQLLNAKTSPFHKALTNLFGVGGSGMVSHHLGLGEDMQAKSCAAFCIWTSAGVALLISTLRKGSLDIPLMFLLNHLFQLSGLVWAIPLADLGALTVAVIMFVPYIKKLQNTL